jgi:predicted  nucleic acid-binding Zn-ribbon protein
MMNRTCTNCGAPLSDNDKFCPNCGLPVENESLEDTAELPVINEQAAPSPEPSAEPEQEAETDESEPEEEKIYVVEKSTFLSRFFYCLLVLLLLGAAAFGYCYFKHPDYLDTAFSYIGVETNFARNIEISGSYNSSKKSTPSPSASAAAK